MAKKKRGSLLITLVLLFGLGLAAFYVYQKFMQKVKLKDKNYTYLYISRTDKLEDVVSALVSDEIITDRQDFEWLAGKMDLESNLHAGKFRINNGMTVRQIINLIKYNKQEKVKLYFNSQIRTPEEFVEYVGSKLDVSESELEEFMSDEKLLAEKFGLGPEASFALVVPGVYEFSWATSAPEFFDKLSQTYKKIWKGRREAAAARLKLSVAEVITLASIVQSESSIESEQQKIAGVYINRLNKNMPLQADPTLKFANKNFEVQRVLDKDKEIDSPYNTYLYRGLPPGPICLVGLQAIDATLNYARHKYIFFCAKPNLNGFSDYSVTYEQHQKYATAYKKALDKRGINR